MSTLKDKFKREPDPKKFQSNWVKFEPGTYTLRLAPSWLNDPNDLPYRRIDQHQGFTYDKKRVAPVCLDWVFAFEDVAKVMKEHGAITKDDFELTKKFGCPMCVIAAALQKKKLKEEAKDFYSSTNYIWNVLVRPDNKPLMWSRSNTFRMDIANNLETKPLLFDPNKGHDFSLNITGNGFARKYSSPSFFTEKSKLNIASGFELHDIDAAIAYGIKPYPTLIEICKSNHTAAVEKSGVNLSKFKL